MIGRCFPSYWHVGSDDRELAELTFGHLRHREGHWAIVDLIGKAGHVRTIPVPDWVHDLLNEWIRAAGIESGKLFRRVSSAGRAWGEAVTEKLVWHVVKEFAAKIGVTKLAPHDLRRSCARLCRWRRMILISVCGRWEISSTALR